MTLREVTLAQLRKKKLDTSVQRVNPTLSPLAIRVLTARKPESSPLKTSDR